MALVKLEDIYDSSKFESLKRCGHFFNPDDVAPPQKSADISETFWKDKRVIVTGSAGMVGSTIIDYLIGVGAKVYGTVKRHAVPHYPNIAHNIVSKKLEVFEVDLTDYNRVSALLKQIEPHVIFHQAAESFVPTSIQQPGYVVENNCLSTVNVLEAATKEDKSLEGVQLACSSEQYGFVKSLDELPVKETNELRPTSTYASTKVFTEYVAKSYYYMYRTPSVITRSFNQEGPRRGAQFFTARIAMQVRDCLNGSDDKIVMGNPNSVRDFTHIYDSAKAQIIAVEKCDRGETYNICSGKGISTGEYARLALRIFNLDKKIPIYVDNSLLRNYERSDVLFDGFIGDNSKFVNKTGWRPTKNIIDIIKDSVAYYSSRKN